MLGRTAILRPSGFLKLCRSSRRQVPATHVLQATTIYRNEATGVNRGLGLPLLQNCCAQPPMFSTVSDGKTDTGGRNGRAPRPWQNRHHQLSKRVASLTESDQLLPYDFIDKATSELVVECCKRKNFKGMQWAHDILDRLLVEKRRLRKEGMLVTIHVDFIQKILYGWAVQADKNKAAWRRMEELLELAIQEALEDEQIFAEAASNKKKKLLLGPGQGISPYSQPTVEIFNTFLRGLSSASRLFPAASTACEKVLDDMAGYHEKFEWHTKPNTKTFTHALSAYANSQRRDAGDNALRILRHMQEVHNTDARTYFEEYGVPYDARNPSANRRRIVTADIVAYTTAMSALVKSKDTSNQAMELLNEILESDTIQADERVFTVAIKAFGVVADKAKSPEQRLEAAKRAEEVLWFMVEYLKPEPVDNDGNVHSTDSKAVSEKGLLMAFNSCLDAWARSYTKESAPNCERLLQKMMTESPVQPDTISFNACLYAWSKSNKFYPDAAERAEQMLNLQHELSDASALGRRVMPDFQSYTIAILSHAYSPNPDKVVHARRLLEALMKHAREEEILQFKNSAGPFSAVINAAARSEPCFPGRDATDDVNGFTSVVNTGDNSYAIAEKTYEELRDDAFEIGVKPDHHCYSAFLKCIAKHTIPQSSEREGKARMVFQDACEAGECSRLVMDGLKVTMGDSVLAIPQLQSKTLPRFWTRNVSRLFRYKG